MLTTPNELDPTKYPLIGPDDPPPFTVINRSGSARAVLTADHAGRAFPKTMHRLGLDEWVLDQHVAWDVGTKELSLQLSAHLDAPAVLAGYSRLLVDCNRSLNDPTAFLEVSDDIHIPGNQGLTEADKAQRAQSFYEPYHSAIEEVLDGFRKRDVVPALISIHSFTPELGGAQRPWHVGVLWDVDSRIPMPLMEKLRAHPDRLHVGDNEPYSGRHPADFTVDHHAEAARLPHVSIEIRQDLIDTDAGAERWADILGEALADILADPGLYRLWEDTDQ